MLTNSLFLIYRSSQHAPFATILKLVRKTSDPKRSSRITAQLRYNNPESHQRDAGMYSCEKGDNPVRIPPIAARGNIAQLSGNNFGPLALMGPDLAPMLVVSLP
jgi:hypothetical protein